MAWAAWVAWVAWTTKSSAHKLTKTVNNSRVPKGARLFCFRSAWPGVYEGFFSSFAGAQKRGVGAAFLESWHFARTGTWSEVATLLVLDRNLIAALRVGRRTFDLSTVAVTTLVTTFASLSCFSAVSTASMQR